MSAQVTLAALFPPSTNEIYNEHLKWLPIPVHTEPTHLDYHLRMLRKCHHFDYVMIQYQKTAAYKGLFEIYRPLIAYLEANSGSNLTRLCEILALYDTLHIQKLNGRCGQFLYIDLLHFFFIVKRNSHSTDCHHGRRR